MFMVYYSIIILKFTIYMNCEYFVIATLSKCTASDVITRSIGNNGKHYITKIMWIHAHICVCWPAHFKTMGTDMICYNHCKIGQKRFDHTNVYQCMPQFPFLTTRCNNNYIYIYIVHPQITFLNPWWLKRGK